MASLSSLPAELLLMVAKSLEWTDYNSLRQACNYNYAVLGFADVASLDRRFPLELNSKKSELLRCLVFSANQKHSFILFILSWAKVTPYRPDGWNWLTGKSRNPAVSEAISMRNLHFALGSLFKEGPNRKVKTPDYRTTFDWEFCSSLPLQQRVLFDYTAFSISLATQSPSDWLMEFMDPDTPFEILSMVIDAISDRYFFNMSRYHFGVEKWVHFISVWMETKQEALFNSLDSESDTGKRLLLWGALHEVGTMLLDSHALAWVFEDIIRGTKGSPYDSREELAELDLPGQYSQLKRGRFQYSAELIADFVEFERRDALDEALDKACRSNLRKIDETDLSDPYGVFLDWTQAERGDSSEEIERPEGWKRIWNPYVRES
ncbi:hypothetical protein BJ508DRAFT_23891 [Ascobolus immersus RN42]|uniref:F-box domain-containing protein n=1 Tax=Ascobolus immersus RN42 TaxID=1160509 RepID=A0A3N4HQB0_ASCIM|nr:hypothetical protein BJ508DRAFT_23891 [Ascobolus immersus RN42]